MGSKSMEYLGVCKLKNEWQFDKIVVVLALMLLLMLPEQTLAFTTRTTLPSEIVDSPACKQDTLASDSISLTGRVIDQHNEPIVNASLKVKRGGIVIAVCVSDFDGNYQFKNIPEGTYDLETSFLGYASKTITGIPIMNRLPIKLDVILASGSRSICCCPIICKPLVDKYMPGKVVISREQIKHLPY